MAGGVYPEMPFDQQMSIPVELTLTGSGDNVTLMRWPVGELDSLRRRTINLDRQAITPGSPLVANTEAKLLDVSFTVSKQDANARRDTSPTHGVRLVFEGTWIPP